jgi:hypothetical protein
MYDGLPGIDYRFCQFHIDRNIIIFARPKARVFLLGHLAAYQFLKGVAPQIFFRSDQFFVFLFESLGDKYDPTFV